MKKILMLLMLFFTASCISAVKVGEYKRVKTVSANYTTAKYDDVVFVDVSGGNKTITLTASSGVLGKVVTIIKSDNSSNYVLVTDGTNTWTVVSQNERLKLFSVGTSWLEEEVKGEIPSGQIISFGGANCPKGFLAAEGGTYDPAKYPKLAAAIGSTWGANALPDGRSGFLVGAGTGAKFTVNTNRSVGDYDDDKFQGHKHELTAYQAGSAFAQANELSMVGGSSPAITVTNPSETIGSPITDGTNGTPRTGDETKPNSLAVKFCIKY